MRARYLFVAAACSLSLLACRDNDVAGVDAANHVRRAPLSAAASEGLGVPDKARPEESIFARLSAAAPSAAGYYYDEKGVLVVLVRDARDDASAKDMARTLLASSAILGPGGGRRTGDVRVERAKFTYRQLSEWRDFVFDNYFGRDLRITSLDLDERANRVVVGLSDVGRDAARFELLARMQMSAIDTTAISFVHAEIGKADVAFSPPATLNDQSSDPLAGGLQIDMDTNGNGEYAASCTLGLVASRNDVVGLITNSHCTHEMFNPDVDRFYQRFPRHVATASVDPQAYTCGLWRCRGADAMFAESSGNVSMAIGKIMKTTAPNGGGYYGGNGTLQVDQVNSFFTVVGLADVGVGTRIEKMGITTGWTWGNVQGTCVDGFIYANGHMNAIRCEDEADYVRDEGDSGAPVFYITGAGDGREVYFLGVHSNREEFGYRARYSRQSRIQSDLGGSWSMLGGQATLEAFLTGPTSVVANISCPYQYVAGVRGGSGGYSYSWTTSANILQNNGSYVYLGFPSAGTYSVSVTVTDSQNHTASDQITVYASATGTCEN